MLAFPNYSASKRLKTLSEKPFDLTAEGALSDARIKEFHMKACGLDLLYATERVDENVIEALLSLADESKAAEKMHAMQSGEVLNKIEGYKSEERTVLHTAMRDLFEHPHEEETAKQATELEKRELEKLEAFLKEHGSKFSELVMIGIGGSNLGPEAAYIALSYLKQPSKKIHFVSNVDPDESASVLQKIDKSETLVVVVSKSGGTLETVTNYNFFKKEFEEAGYTPSNHFVAMTGEGSPLDDKSAFLECFYSWDFIGGRYCTTAMYGAVILSFAIGFENFMEFLRGANAMDKVALEKDPKKNMPLFLALLSVWNHNFLNTATFAMIPYCSALRRLPAHIQQVEMESNGKHIDRHGVRVNFETGMIIWGEPGTNAQHSFYQLIHQGTPIIPLELIGFRESQYGKDHEIEGTTNQQKLNANLVAQAISLAQGKGDENPNKRFEGNRPSHILLGERLDPYTMGALFALMEHRVAFEGFIWDINSFDQEGVQLGKKLANRVLETMKNESSYPEGEAFRDVLDI